MSIYRKIFKQVLENGPGYVPSNANTSGNGGALGAAPSIGAPGVASGTPGTDTYATGDARIPTSIFGGKFMKRNKPEKLTLRKKAVSKKKK